MTTGAKGLYGFGGLDGNTMSASQNSSAFRNNLTGPFGGDSMPQADFTGFDNMLGDANLMSQADMSGFGNMIGGAMSGLSHRARGGAVAIAQEILRQHHEREHARKGGVMGAVAFAPPPKSSYPSVDQLANTAANQAAIPRNFNFNNSMQAYYDLINSGKMTPTAAQAYVGNFSKEAQQGGQLNFGAVNEQTGRAIGMAQWLGPRASAFKDYASSTNQPWQSESANIGYFNKERDTDRRIQHIDDAIQQQTDPHVASAMVAHNYEHPGAGEIRSSMPARMAFTDKVGEIANNGNPFQGNALNDTMARLNAPAPEPAAAPDAAPDSSLPERKSEEIADAPDAEGMEDYARGGVIGDALYRLRKHYAEGGGEGDPERREHELPMMARAPEAAQMAQLDRSVDRPSSNASDFVAHQLRDDGRQLPQSDEKEGWRTGERLGLMGAAMAPGTGAMSAAGYYPSVDHASGFEPSLRENVREGNYGTAALQGLGAAGDAAYAIPVVGPAVGGALKAPFAVKMAMSALPMAGKVAREAGEAERGIQGSVEAARSYPMAPRDRWYGEGTYEQFGGRMTNMSPDQFLSSARPMQIDDVARENIDSLKSHIENGGELDPLTLYKDGKEDGRHRAHAAKELGIESVPVINYRAESPQLTKSQSQAAMRAAWEAGNGDAANFKNWQHQWNMQEGPNYAPTAPQPKQVKQAPTVEPMEGYQPLVNPLGMASRGYEVAGTMLPKNASWKEMESILRDPNRGNVKAEEMDNAGFTFKPEDKVTREQVAEAFQKAYPQVTDTRYGPFHHSDPEIQRLADEVDKANTRESDAENAYYFARQHHIENNNFVSNEGEIPNAAQLWSRHRRYRTGEFTRDQVLEDVPEALRPHAAALQQAHDDAYHAQAAYDRHHDRMGYGDNPEAPWESYSTPGGSAYRVSALTLPTMKFTGADRHHPEAVAMYGDRLKASEEKRARLYDEMHDLQVAQEDRQREFNKQVRDQYRDFVREAFTDLPQVQRDPSRLEKYVDDAVRRIDLKDALRALGRDPQELNQAYMDPPELIKARKEWNSANTQHGMLSDMLKEKSDEFYARDYPEWMVRPFTHQTHLPGARNPVAHVRMKDREITDPVTGETHRVLGVDEIQSDWGQGANEKGIKDPAADKRREELTQKINELTSERNNLRNAIYEKHYNATKHIEDAITEEGKSHREAFERSKGLKSDVDAYNNAYDQIMLKYQHLLDPHEAERNEALRGLEHEYQTQRDAIERERSALPKSGVMTKAPYITNTDHWTDLSVKRVLQEAARLKHNKIFIAGGAEHARRYQSHLRQELKSVNWSERPDNGREIVVHPASYNRREPLTFHVDHKGKIVGGPSGSIGNNVESLLGKEAAKKIMSDRRGEFDMQNYMMGSEGYRKYYEEKVPSRFKQILKHLDPEARVQLGKMQDGNGNDVQGVWVDLSDHFHNNYNQRMKDQGYVFHGYKRGGRVKLAEGGDPDLPMMAREEPEKHIHDAMQGQRADEEQKLRETAQEPMHPGLKTAVDYATYSMAQPDTAPQRVVNTAVHIPDAVRGQYNDAKDAAQYFSDTMSGQRPMDVTSPEAAQHSMTLAGLAGTGGASMGSRPANSLGMFLTEKSHGVDRQALQTARNSVNGNALGYSPFGDLFGRVATTPMAPEEATRKYGWHQLGRNWFTEIADNTAGYNGQRLYDDAVDAEHRKLHDYYMQRYGQVPGFLARNARTVVDKRGFDTTMDQLWDHPELWKAEPEVGKYPTHIIGTDNVQAALGPDTNGLFAYSQYPDGRRVNRRFELNGALITDPGAGRSVVGHEVQHAIQERGGGSHGTDIDVEEKIGSPNPLLARWNNGAQSHPDVIAYHAARNSDEMRAIAAQGDEYYTRLHKVIGLPERDAEREAQKYLIDTFPAYVRLCKERARLMSMGIPLEQPAKVDAHESYRFNLGEAQARSTEHRLDWDMARRKANDPRTTLPYALNADPKRGFIGPEELIDRKRGGAVPDAQARLRAHHKKPSSKKGKESSSKSTVAGRR